MELLTLKWNKHSTTFFSLLTSLRHKENLTDVYLGCDGELFPAHQIVLSICSDYFAKIFQTYKAKSPVIILKDVKKQDLICLLDYMYIGEVNVKQSELASLITAAELLQIKGLAVDDDPDPVPSTKRAKTPEREEQHSPKRKRRHTKDHEQSSHQKRQSTSFQSEKIIPIDEIKLEPDVVKIKENDPIDDDNQDSLGTESQFTGNMEQLKEFNKEEYEESGEYDDTMDYTAEDNSSHAGETMPFDPSTSENPNDSTMTPFGPTQVHQCPFCSKCFSRKGHLKLHERIHTGDKPFSCNFCSHKCNAKHNLKSHVMRKHGFNRGLVHPSPQQ